MARGEPIRVVALGAACLDVKALPLAPVVPGTSSPAQIRLSVGGSARNVSENLARLGVRVALLSAVGIDAIGQRLLERTSRAGVDVSRVIRSPDHSTGTHLTLFTDCSRHGYALDDVSQLLAVTPEYLQAHRGLFRHAQMLVMDANLDTDTTAAALSLAKEHGVRVSIDPVSVRRAYALRPYYSEFTMVTPNVQEAEALLDVSIAGPRDAQAAARRMVASGVEIAVITMAEEGLVYVTSEGHGRIPAIRCDVVDWTGAGDALCAAVVYGLINEVPVDECMRLGVAAATMTLKCPESVCPEMSLDRLYANMVI